MNLSSGVPEYERRYPLETWINDFAALQEEGTRAPDLQAWLSARFQLLYPDVHNEPERSQMLLDALRYVETNIEGLNQGHALVAGKDQYLVNPELAAALYGGVIQNPPGGIMHVPVTNILSACEHYHRHWNPPSSE